jgi:hypothetical protein
MVEEFPIILKCGIGALSYPLWNNGAFVAKELRSCVILNMCVSNNKL